MIPTPLPGRLLRRILPLSVRDVVLGDLDEEHQERMARSGRRARVALGADRADVMSLIVRQGMGPAAAGLVAGLAASLAATPVLRSLLYGVTPTDAGTLALAAGVLLAVAFAGCLVPAWRACASTRP